MLKEGLRKGSEKRGNVGNGKEGRYKIMDQGNVKR